ncbi:Hypothetical predicted protein [Podarcis lilfordi]|uniref:Uncharacterized protein n=1 Tax=Podarcis lilfordi TaxID=74358 RepID=A0AA35P5D4_9SAUR|nr:Hypothetical predicted protein [Podarcis lilfordi]
MDTAASDTNVIQSHTLQANPFNVSLICPTGMVFRESIRRQRNLHDLAPPLTHVSHWHRRVNSRQSAGVQGTLNTTATITEI